MFQKAYVTFLMLNLDMLITSSVWVDVDEDAITAILPSSEIVVESESKILSAIVKWVQDESRVEKLLENLRKLLPLIRFPMMMPADLAQFEATEFFKNQRDILMPYVLMAYRYHALPQQEQDNFQDDLAKPSHFQLRNYTDHRYGISTVLKCSQIDQPAKQCLILPMRAAHESQIADGCQVDVYFYPFGSNSERSQTDADDVVSTVYRMLSLPK